MKDMPEAGILLKEFEGKKHEALTSPAAPASSEMVLWPQATGGTEEIPNDQQLFPSAYTAQEQAGDEMTKIIDTARR